MDGTSPYGLLVHEQQHPSNRERQREQPCVSDPMLPQCQDGIYSYILNEQANMTFLVCYVILTFCLICIVLRVRWAYAFSIAMFAGLTCEILGYVARVWSTGNQLQTEPFYMQIVCLTIGPVFMAAAIYLCMRRLVVCFGPSYSPLSAKNFTRIFIPCDLVSLILQAAGGALAAKAHKAQDQATLNRGTNIMIAGLAFQVFTMSAFTFIGFIFLWRVTADHKVRVRDGLVQNPNIVALSKSLLLQIFILSIITATLIILGRCCYRVAELSEGWSGHLMKSQTLFVVCEGVFILLASVLLIASHPAIAATEVLQAGGQFGSVRLRLPKLTCFMNGERRAGQDPEQGLASAEKNGDKNEPQPVILPLAPQPQPNSIFTIPDQSPQAFSRRE